MFTWIRQPDLNCVLEGQCHMQSVSAGTYMKHAFDIYHEKSPRNFISNGQAPPKNI